MSPVFVSILPHRLMKWPKFQHDGGQPRAQPYKCSWLIFTGDGARLMRKAEPIKTETKMKNRWLTGAAAAALTVATAVAAQAADLPTRKEAPVPVFVPPPFTWTGFYVGVNAGGVWASGSRSSTLYNYGLDTGFGSYYPNGFGNNQSGFIGGGQAGYNWQSGAAVFGVETDFDWTNLKKDFNNTSNGYVALATYQAALNGDLFYTNASAKLNWLGTTRARIGFVATPDNRLMFYGTGGVAYGGGSGHVNFYDSYNNFYFSGKPSSSRVGWTIGGGVEYAITNNITIKGEYLYYNLGSSNLNIYPNYTNSFASNYFGPGTYIHSKFTYDGSIVRAGVNYKF